MDYLRSSKQLQPQRQIHRWWEYVVENFAAEGTNISRRMWWRSNSEQKDGGFYTSNQMFS